MNICEFIQEKVAIGEINDDVLAHLRICHECKAFADDLERFLSCELPEVEPPKHVDDAIRAVAQDVAAANRLHRVLPDLEPPKHVDDAVRAAGAFTASAYARKNRVKKAFRVLIPVAAALAVCFLFYFEPLAKPQPLAVPTQATAAADWTGAVMDGELTKVSMELTNSMTDLSLSDTDLLIAQLEADFASYAEN